MPQFLWFRMIFLLVLWFSVSISLTKREKTSDLFVAAVASYYSFLFLCRVHYTVYFSLVFFIFHLFDVYSPLSLSLFSYHMKDKQQQKINQYIFYRNSYMLVIAIIFVLYVFFVFYIAACNSPDPFDIGDPNLFNQTVCGQLFRPFPCRYNDPKIDPVRLFPLIVICDGWTGSNCKTLHKSIELYIRSATPKQIQLPNNLAPDALEGKL